MADVKVNEVSPALIVEIYKAYLEDTHQLRDERQTVNNIRVTIVTLLLGAQAYILSNMLTEGQGIKLRDNSFIAWSLPIIAFVVGIVGFVFCQNWERVEKGFSKTLAFKYQQLEHMEQEWASVLQKIGAVLFTNEAQARRDARAKTSKQRGIGLRTLELQDFFSRLFVIDSLAALGIKIVFISGFVAYVTR